MSTGAPRGPKADKIWANALRLAVMRESEETDQNGKKRNYLSIIARNLVHRAAEGDVAATKEIGDRLDGRPAQTVAGDPDAPLSIEFRTIYEK